MDVNQFYSENFQPLLRFVQSMTHNLSWAEDITQETFVKALQNLWDLEEMGPAQQKNWLYRTAKNLFIDQFRRSKLAQKQLLAEETYEDDLTQIQVQQVLAQLPPETRQLVTLRYFSGLNSTQLSELYHLPAATIRTRLRAASKVLRRLYLTED